MENKYFPIKSNTACQLKWTWSTLFLLTGATRSCHRVDGGFVTAENFKTFHNTPKKIAQRQSMLQGQWPDGQCVYCKNMEQAGGQSDRQFHLQIPNLVPPELDHDPTAVNVTPRILEVYLDNVCNMSCIYCWDGFSSRIHQENDKHGVFEKNGVTIMNQLSTAQNVQGIDTEFWNWLEENYQTLRRIHVLGGEPFYQSKFETMLEFLESNHNPDLEFNIVTNLKVSQAKLEQYLDRLRLMLGRRQIGRVDITCSIDCWDQEQEYIRNGIDMNQWRQAFEFMVHKKWLRLNINQAITGLGIKSMPDLLKYVNQQRIHRPIQHYHMAVVSVPFLNPGIFGQNFFDRDFDKILNIMPNITWDDQNSRNLMNTLRLQCAESQRNGYELKRLETYLTELDRRRNTSWSKTFPWLTEQFDNVV